jgi:hypothetical protein
MNIIGLSYGTAERKSDSVKPWEQGKGHLGTVPSGFGFAYADRGFIGRARAGACLIYLEIRLCQFSGYPDIVLMAVGVSVGIGIFFGFYPAWLGSERTPFKPEVRIIKTPLQYCVGGFVYSDHNL